MWYSNNTMGYVIGLISFGYGIAALFNVVFGFIVTFLNPDFLGM